MHQESKIVELRRAGAGVDPARDKPGIAPAIMPSEVDEGRGWVLREIRGAEAIRPEGGVLHQTGKRRSAATWLMAGLIAIGALVCIAAGTRHPFAWAWHSSNAGVQHSVTPNRPGGTRGQLAA